MDGPILLESLRMAKKKRNNMPENNTPEEQIDVPVPEAAVVAEPEPIAEPEVQPEPVVAPIEPVAPVVDKNAGKVIPTAF